MEEKDLQQIINYCHEFGKQLLTTQDAEFYPFAVKIKSSGELIAHAWFDGDDFPSSKSVLDNLRNSLAEEIKSGLIRAYGIAFDGLVSKNGNSQKVDTIVVECFSSFTQEKITHYFPYKIKDGAVGFGEDWSERQ